MKLLKISFVLFSVIFQTGAQAEEERLPHFPFRWTYESDSEWNTLYLAPPDRPTPNIKVGDWICAMDKAVVDDKGRRGSIRLIACVRGDDVFQTYHACNYDRRILIFSFKEEKTKSLKKITINCEPN